MAGAASATRGVALGLNLPEHTGGVVFTFLNIRLIKWMNAEHVSCDSSGEFPAEEFSAQIVSITRAVGRLGARRFEAARPRSNEAFRSPLRRRLINNRSAP